MISSVEVIALGTVRGAEATTDGCCPRYHHYTIEILQVLAGDLGAKSPTVVYVEQGSPHFSMIVPASGIEHQLKVGDRYIFLFESATEQKGLGVVLTRAEPETRRDAVLKAWSERNHKANNENK